jgi:curli biogenesis system outer membrane secretion channel CsgG
VQSFKFHKRRIYMKNAIKVIAAIAVLMMITGCSGTMPQMGGGSGYTATGGVGGQTAHDRNSQLENCTETLGTLAVYEDQTLDWWHYYYRRYPNLGSTLPVLRMIIQQSNCFVVVERGRVMENMDQERRLEQSGEMRGGSNFGKGQIVAADYTMSPSIQFSEKGTSGLGGAIGGLIPGIGGQAVGVLAGKLKANEAATTLLLIDNRSGVQISASVGNAKNFDFGLFGATFGGKGAGGAGGYTNTPEGKVITAAFADSYNQMVRSLLNYQAQSVKGGLGTGGSLGVQGGSTDASKKIAP